ncbi:MAG: glycosyltransferase [Clostridia bacterium]|nr:glycosyltransferase [Clostridia bacterium]
MPKFSIIVPIYNVENYIEKCIDSILAQSFSDFELILVDDGSPDRCPQICDEYAKKDGRVKVIHKNNEGPSAARNTGLSEATGEYCWFVDSDDCLNPEALKILTQYANGKNDIIDFNFVGFSEKNPPDFSKEAKERSFSGKVEHKEMCRIISKACTKRMLPFAWRRIYRLYFLKKSGIRFKKGLNFGEDSVFNMEAFLRAESLYFINECLYGYRDRTDGLSRKTENIFNYNTVTWCEMYDSFRDESYEKYCEYPDEAYYEDAGLFTIKTLYVYAMLNRLYMSSSKSNYFLFKKISSLPMIKKAFSRFDVDKIKSKSLEWYMFKFVKHRLYLPAFVIYRFFIF